MGDVPSLQDVQTSMTLTVTYNEPTSSLQLELVASVDDVDVNAKKDDGDLADKTYE